MNIPVSSFLPPFFEQAGRDEFGFTLQEFVRCGVLRFWRLPAIVVAFLRRLFQWPTVAARRAQRLSVTIFLDGYAPLALRIYCLRPNLFLPMHIALFSRGGDPPPYLVLVGPVSSSVNWGVTFCQLTPCLSRVLVTPPPLILFHCVVWTPCPPAGFVADGRSLRLRWCACPVSRLFQRFRPCNHPPDPPEPVVNLSAR